MVWDASPHGRPALSTGYGTAQQVAQRRARRRRTPRGAPRSAAANIAPEFRRSREERIYESGFSRPLNQRLPAGRNATQSVGCRVRSGRADQALKESRDRLDEDLRAAPVGSAHVFEDAIRRVASQVGRGGRIYKPHALSPSDYSAADSAWDPGELRSSRDRTLAGSSASMRAKGPSGRPPSASSSSDQSRLVVQPPAEVFLHQFPRGAIRESGVRKLASPPCNLRFQA